MADVEEVEVVVAHSERATLRVGDVFLKIDADQTRTDVEAEAMAMAPVPTPEILWQTPPVLALAALPGTALGRLGEPSTASPAAWAAAGAAARMPHAAPLLSDSSFPERARFFAFRFPSLGQRSGRLRGFLRRRVRGCCASGWFALPGAGAGVGGLRRPRRGGTGVEFPRILRDRAVSGLVGRLGLVDRARRDPGELHAAQRGGASRSGGERAAPGAVPAAFVPRSRPCRLRAAARHRARAVRGAAERFPGGRCVSHPGVDRLLPAGAVPDVRRDLIAP